ncbi:phospholipase B1, membrane-associated-like [Anabrus simplex]|uniref:phospholipase B1, membrane-associated-like n=1 Tax=Anabrus simplex TaxID=316456 RepID=UPI0035A30B93
MEVCIKTVYGLMTEITTDDFTAIALLDNPLSWQSKNTTLFKSHAGSPCAIQNGISSPGAAQKFLAIVMLLSGLGGVLLLLVSESCAQSSLASLRTYELVKEAAVNSFMPRSRDRHLHKLLQHEKRQPPVPAEKPFPCSTDNSRSQSRPTSVHQLRPGDIDVVGAIGDSLTAGNGIEALNMFQVFVENRGSAWSIGGDRTWRELLTLPNILKEFNPNLVGYSLGDSLSHHRSSQFNVADPAAMSQDTHFQARNLWKRMRGDSRIDFNNDWKLVTLMIGANDFCSNMCYVNSTEVPEKHRLDLIKTLDFLRDNMPRTLVNVVAPPNLEVLMNFKGMPDSCFLMVGFECSCLFGLAYRQRRQEFIDLMRRWQQLEIDVVSFDRIAGEEDEGCSDAALRASYKVALQLARAGKPFMEGPLIKSMLLDEVETMNPTLAPAYSRIPLPSMTITRRISDFALDESTDISDTSQLAIFLRGVYDDLHINSDRYHEKDDFTVVFQPFTMHITFPTTGDTTDYTYMSYDCFHLSQKTHALAANGLWNNMLQPVGNKSTNWPSLFSEFLCPSEKQPYIYTASNSDASP